MKSNEIASNDIAGQACEFYPLPPSGHTLHGLRRSHLYALAREGVIKSISLRSKGKRRGRRLIVAESLLAYLRGLEAQQCGGAAETECHERG